MSLAALARWVRDIDTQFGPLVKSTAVVVAAGWALIQYYGNERQSEIAAVRDARTKETSDPMFYAWREISIDNLEDSLALRQAVKDVHATARYQMMLGNTSKVSFDLLMSFYENLYTCYSSGICDKETLVETFDSEVVSVYHNYAFYIACERKITQDPTYAAGLTDLYSIKHMLNTVPITDSDCSLSS